MAERNVWKYNFRSFLRTKHVKHKNNVFTFIDLYVSYVTFNFVMRYYSYCFHRDIETKKGRFTSQRARRKFEYVVR